LIAHLDGTVSSVAPDGAVIEVGGVGLLVQCAPGTLARLRAGERARVATSLVVREDALTLYGFAGDDERNTFELLQTASGIGPRLALAMLAVFTPDALRRAVAAEDLTALTTVPGIGRKGAQRIVLELAGRLGRPGDGAGGTAAASRCGRAWSISAGRPETPTRRSRRSSPNCSPSRRRVPGSATASPVTASPVNRTRPRSTWRSRCAPPCGCWGAHDRQ
jgi:Holliday junction DNA helicase RuvA